MDCSSNRVPSDFYCHCTQRLFSTRSSTMSKVFKRLYHVLPGGTQLSAFPPEVVAFLRAGLKKIDAQVRRTKTTVSRLLRQY